MDGSQTDFRLCDDSKTFSAFVVKKKESVHKSVTTLAAVHSERILVKNIKVSTFEGCSSQSSPTPWTREEAEFGSGLL